MAIQSSNLNPSAKEKVSADLRELLNSKFIVLDGPDGCGKSTQHDMLMAWAESKGTQAVGFRDPGTTQIGEKIRHILLDVNNSQMDVRSELLLYMAARAQLWSEKICPALAEGKCVILDRWLSSTCAYQGFAGGFGIDKVIDIAGHCLEKPWPDITIILDVDCRTAEQRMQRTLDRMEQKGKQYHQKVRQGFVQLAEKIGNCVVIDATQDAQTIHKQVTEAIERIFGRNREDK